MRKLIAGINMTIDGYCDHTAIIPDEEIHHHYAELLNNAGAILYGRITYQLMQVLDNLNTHFEKSFYETFTQKEAEKILRKITFCYTPKHGSWLNMAEIEINVMDRECLGEKIGNEKLLKQQLKSWTKERNKLKKKILWKFTKQDADKKLSKHYAHN